MVDQAPGIGPHASAGETGFVTLTKLYVRLIFTYLYPKGDRRARKLPAERCVTVHHCTAKEATMFEAGPGGSPKRSQPPPSAAEEIGQYRQ